jgi:alpha,alpha-trehalase
MGPRFSDTGVGGGSDWTFYYEHFAPEQERLREALCTLGNGYLATRGAAEESTADGIHYPGTYLAGGYDRLVSEVAGRRVENEDLVNWPNWLCLVFRRRNGTWLDLTAVRVLEYLQELDLRGGVLRRRVRFEDADGARTLFESRRLVHMGEPHLAAIELTIEAENWSGGLEVRSALDGRVVNAGVERYRELRGDHLQPESTGRVGEDGILLRVRTKQSHVQMAQAARTRVFHDGKPLAADRCTDEDAGWIEQRLTFDVEAGKPVRVEKVVAVYTSRDRAIADCVLESETAVCEAPPFTELERGHRAAWQRIWRQCDLELECECEGPVQNVLRLHVFHLLQTVSIHSIDLDVSVPARGLHGEAYRGHIFWDELFIFPFLTLRIPELTRALLMYRYRRLPEARRAARAAGYRGAMFPWQSGSNGREESQTFHLNPRSGAWVPDNSRLQRHIGAAIAYNVWLYFQATNDGQFLSFYGAEMVLEIARFWASLASYDGASERWTIRGVMGPDEYHDARPGADAPGIDDNAYTNLMAVWVLARALELLEILAAPRVAELRATLDLSDDELARWDEISRKMRLSFHDGGVLSQFEGWDELAELDWDGYRARNGDIQRLDRILDAEGDTTNRYKLAKQADVLMLFYLFSTEGLTELFARLGYEFRPESIRRTIDYYDPRTAHGSTLSRVVSSWVTTRSDRQRSWELFRQALVSDVADVQGGTTAEGVHLGAMAGTVDIVQRCYAGIELRGGLLWLNPRLPAQLDRLGIRIRHRGNWYRIEVRQDVLRVALDFGRDGVTHVGIRGRVYRFERGKPRQFRLRDGTFARARQRRVRTRPAPEPRALASGRS